MRVNVVCRNHNDDRVIPRFSRYLAERLGWTLSAAPEPGHDAVYLSAYFESQLCKRWPDAPVMAYFTHYETDPPGNAKAKLFDRTAERVNLRIATAGMYAGYLEGFGPTVQVHPPVERERFTIPPVGAQHAAPSAAAPLRAGFSGYTYRNGRKGEDLAAALVASEIGQRVEWRASGRGWPVPTRNLTWREMPAFFQGLDIYVCTALVEGVPMPPLEALACGVSIVIPRGVGLLDELPDLPGIVRYARGDSASLIAALGEAIEGRGAVEREALRAVTDEYTIERWCDEHAEAVRQMSEQATPATAKESGLEATEQVPARHFTGSKRGIYCVAFGEPARESALRMMESAKAHMPEIPIALCSDRKIGPEDVLLVEPDSDVGARRNKLRAYELAPAEWESVLFLDADTEVVADISFYFQLIEDGWEFVICTDPHLDSFGFLKNRATVRELDDTTQRVMTLRTTQYNGGVWAFARNERVARFFARWLTEWEKYAQRDQGALTRAMYTEPLKVYLLGNEWNTFPRYTRGIETAGLMHYPGEARRWSGMLPGRLDDASAWQAAERFEARRQPARGGRRR